MSATDRARKLALEDMAEGLVFVCKPEISPGVWVKVIIQVLPDGTWKWVD